MELDFAFIKFLIFLGFLTFASIQDVRSRYVSDLVWIAAAALLVPIIILEVLFQQFYLFATLLSVIFAVAVTVPLNRIGFLGGADVFALILLAVYMPVLDNQNILALPIMAVVANASILSMSGFIINFIRNINAIIRGQNVFSGFENESKYRKILAMFFGHRVTEVRGLYLPMESSENGRRRFSFVGWRESQEFVQGKDLWVTQALPFIVYITAGYAFLFLVGDMLHMLKSAVLS